MSDVRPVDASAAPFRSAVALFEQAWQSGTAPSVETFLSQDGPLGPAVATDPGLARELLLIDLEFRWRKLRDAEPAAVTGSLPPHPRAEDYVRRFPQLFPHAEQVAELVAEEYVVRHRWGDRPSLSELVRRFPGREDVVLAAEQALRNVDVPTQAHRSDAKPADDDVAEADVPRVGSLWGRYVIAQLLGAGKFGSVFRCYDPQLNRFVALKVIRLGVHGGDRRESALREARAAAAIRHPNVVAVFDVIENEQGEIGIVTEFVAGEPLEQHLARGVGDPAETLRWAEAIAGAIHEAHVAGVVHRDLKPANILIDVAGRPRVTDFGLALLTTEAKPAVGEIAGTPRYMSPEQIRGERNLDGRSDVWSLGVILYRGLTNHFPFPDADPNKLFRSIEHEPAPPLHEWNPHVSPRLEEICLRCLEKDPRRRWASAAELSQALQSYAETLGRSVAASVSVSLPASAAVLAESGAGSSWQRQAAGNLPRAASEIVGRGEELTQLDRLLASPDVWLVTLCGPGGVGKTRLALEAGRRLKSPGGVWWIDWSSVRDGVAAAQSVLTGLRSRVPEKAVLDEHVSQVLGCLPPLLLVLDNAEQIVDVAAALIRRWSDANPHVRFLVTSRERLHLPGERVLEVAPLSVPDDDADPATSDGVQLFIRRATEVQPDLQWDAEQLRRAGAICRAVEGLPLAVELAARRAGVLSLDEIAAALRNQLDGLKAGPREQPERRQTLSAVVGWSFDLLTDVERATLVHLSRFVGGFTRDTALGLLRALPGFVPTELNDLLQSLREKSLLRGRNTTYGLRFSMLEMIRSYAERLRTTVVDAATEPALDEAWATTLPTELAKLREQLSTPTAAIVMQRYADEAENLSQIERWAERAGRPDVAVRALLPLVDAVPLRGAAPDLVDRLQKSVEQLGAEHANLARQGRSATARVLRHEGRWHEALEAARAAAEQAGDGDPATTAEALRITAEMQRRLGLLGEAEVTLERADAVAAKATSFERARCQVEWAVLLAQRGAVTQAQVRLERAAALLVGHAAAPLEAEIERRRAQLLLQSGRPHEALAHAERAETAARTAGDLHLLQSALVSRAAVCVDLGRYEPALIAFYEAERFARRLGDRRGLAVVWGNRALALADVGDRIAALESFRRAEQLNRLIDAKFGVAANLAGQANVHALEGDFAAAWGVFDDASRLAEASNFEFLAAVIQGDRGVAKFLAGDAAAARDDLGRAMVRLEAVGSSQTQEVFCFAAFAAAAERASGDANAAAIAAGRAQALAAAGIVSRDHPKPRVQHAFQLLTG